MPSRDYRTLSRGDQRAFRGVALRMIRSGVPVEVVGRRAAARFGKSGCRKVYSLFPDARFEVHPSCWNGIRCSKAEAQADTRIHRVTENFRVNDASGRAVVLLRRGVLSDEMREVVDELRGFPAGDSYTRGVWKRRNQHPTRAFDARLGLKKRRRVDDAIERLAAAGIFRRVRGFALHDGDLREEVASLENLNAQYLKYKLADDPGHEQVSLFEGKQLFYMSHNAFKAIHRDSNNMAGSTDWLFWGGEFTAGELDIHIPPLGWFRFQVQPGDGMLARLGDFWHRVQRADGTRLMGNLFAGNALAEYTAVRKAEKRALRKAKKRARHQRKAEKRAQHQRKAEKRVRRKTEKCGKTREESW